MILNVIPIYREGDKHRVLKSTPPTQPLLSTCCAWAELETQGIWLQVPLLFQSTSLCPCPSLTLLHRNATSLGFSVLHCDPSNYRWEQP